MIKRKNYWQCYEDRNKTNYHDRPFGRIDDGELPEANPDVLPEPDKMKEFEASSWLEDALQKLTAQERYLIISHFGLFKAPLKTYRELGEDLDLTHGMIQKSLKKALRKLRRWMLRLNKGEN